MTKELLPKVVASKIIGTFQASMAAKTDEVIGKVEPVINAYEKKKKDEDAEPECLEYICIHGDER